MQTIERFIIDKIPPRQTNVVWIDISGGKPVYKTYLNGEWVLSDLTTELKEQLRSFIDSYGLSLFNNDVGYITKAGLQLAREWDNSSIQDLAHDIFNDQNAVVGSRYTCLFGGNGLPDGMGNGELEILVESGIDDIKIILMSVTSIDVAPYSWFGTYDGINWSGWRTSLTPVKTQNPQDGFLPNVMYKLGNINSTTTFTLNTTGLDQNIVNEYMWSFNTLGDLSAPTVNFNLGSSIIWKNGSEPTVGVDKYYRITIIDDIADCMEVDLA